MADLICYCWSVTYQQIQNNLMKTNPEAAQYIIFNLWLTFLFLYNMYIVFNLIFLIN